MNLLKSMIAQLHESAVEKGKSDNEAKFTVAILFAVILFLNFLFISIALYILDKTSSYQQNIFLNWLSFLGKNRFGYKTVILFSILFIATSLFLLFRSKFYMSILDKYYNLSYEDQKKSDSRGKILAGILFLLPVIGIVVCLLNLE